MIDLKKIGCAMFDCILPGPGDTEDANIRTFLQIRRYEIEHGTPEA